MTLNLADPELELIDPTPNVHTLFIHFDKMFFWTKLSSRAVVRWSKRMYSCAGVCSYEGRAGLCDIALSEPLLKLRPRKDLIETLLHEMIHAYLFITGNDRDRDGHGPNFQSHMHRINKAAGLKISIYHDFHDEVKLYQTHWWRCNGPCQKSKPYFGIVRRSMNRAPGPTDFWWEDHSRKCGGTFVKIKEPEKHGKKGTPKTIPKPMGDITKYVNNGTKIDNGTKSGIRSNGSGTLVVTKKNVVFSPKSVVDQKPIIPFDGKGQTLSDKTINSNNVAETVRNVWLSKTTIGTTNTPKVDDINSKLKEVWAKKQLDINKNSIAKPNFNSQTKRASTDVKEPPAKIKKIDDYFKATASTLLKDVYGEDFGIHQTDNNKLVAIQNPSSDLVNCPICQSKVINSDINRHIDECLNKDVIDRLSNEPSTSSLGDVKLTNTADKPIKTEPIESKVIVKIEDERIKIENERIKIEDEKIKIENERIKIENERIKIDEHICPCCGDIITKTTEDHLDECLAFFDNNTTIPEEGSAIVTIVIDDDDNEDIIDESMTMNATGTKTPCPVCLTMVEQNDMNDHLDVCLSS